MPENANMNALLRRAAFGLTEEEFQTHVDERRKKGEATDMNALLRAGRGTLITEEVSNNAAE